jgi:hypothetical protein
MASARLLQTEVSRWAASRPPPLLPRLRLTCIRASHGRRCPSPLHNATYPGSKAGSQFHAAGNPQINGPLRGQSRKTRKLHSTQTTRAAEGVPTHSTLPSQPPSSQPLLSKYLEPTTCGRGHNRTAESEIGAESVGVCLGMQTDEGPTDTPLSPLTPSHVRGAKPATLPPDPS